MTPSDILSLLASHTSWETGGARGGKVINGINQIFTKKRKTELNAPLIKKQSFEKMWGW